MSISFYFNDYYLFAFSIIVPISCKGWKPMQVMTLLENLGRNKKLPKCITVVAPELAEKKFRYPV